MKPNKTLMPWMTTTLIAIFLSACATTKTEPMDGPPVDDGQIQSQTGTTGDGSLSGADATGLDGSDTGGVTAIGDDSAMSAMERLEQTEGDLSNRIVYFEFDSAKLTDESLALLEIHGNFIAGNGEVSVRLEGHADERGSREYNIALGDRRAQSVRRVLLFQGAATDQIETVSYGEEQPAVSGHSEEAWAKNRRVELIYTVN